MLTVDEIRSFILEDENSTKKKLARIGDRYYDGDHDIKGCRFFYYDTNGILQEDKFRTNVKIPHPFFKELTDEATQYILSDDEQIIVCEEDEALQKILDDLFNNNDDFMANLSDVLTDVQTRGFSYMYAYKDENDVLKFCYADSIGVVEVDGKLVSDKKDHVIYWYIDRIDMEGHKIKKIEDWTDENITYWIQKDNGDIEMDKDPTFNPRPHILYTIGDDNKMYYDTFGTIPFFRIDNNRKQLGNLKPIKDLIDDYDMMASSLSNNLIDFDNPLYVIKGYEGDNLDELQKNLKTKKIVGVDSEGDIGVRTVDVPYEARCKKLELDEKNIYRFGMGLNLSSLKDTSATTNMAIKAAYSLLDLRAKKLEKQARKFLKKIVGIAIDDYNKQNKTAYDASNIKYCFSHEIIANEQECAQIELTEAQIKQTEVNTLLSAVNQLGLSEEIIKVLCNLLDIDFEAVKKELEKDSTYQAQVNLDNKPIEEDVVDE